MCTFDPSQLLYSMHISLLLQPFDEVLAEVVVVVAIVKESGCSECDLRAGLQLLQTDTQVSALLVGWC